MTSAELVEIISSIVLGLFSIVQGSFLAFIARQQWVTNDKKLKLDLYNKRFEVYSDTIDFYQETISGEVEVSKDVHRQFIKSKNASKYLFSKDPSIYDTLDEMHEKSFKIKGFRKAWGNFQTDAKPDVKSTEAFQSDLRWCNKAMENLHIKLARFLNQ